MPPINGFKRNILPAVAVVMSILLLGAAPRGIPVTVTTPQGKTIDLYRDSYALVVGNGNYTGGWDALPGAVRDVKEVAAVLEKSGFHVTLKTDLTKEGFDRALGEFAYEYGQDKNNRLLFYYAGHGHTRKMATGEELGYLVMVDAPVPETDPLGFSLASVDMQVLVTQAKMISSKHVLFMFDSCFSGSILNLRERVVPRNITESVQYPVRQFITAGRADEPVPDHSVFKQAFLDLLQGRDKEPIPDGYITGEELGLYLKNKVPQYNPTQHPQYGKIRDIRLDKGDFVFTLARSSGAVVEKPALQKVRATLSVESNLRGARVFVDGREVGTTPLDNAAVTAGKHSIRVEQPGYEPYQRRIIFEAGRSVSLYVDLSISKPIESRLFVETEPEGARIRILNIGPKFYQGIELEAGRYHVEVSAGGYQVKEMWVSVGEGEDKNVLVRLEPVVAKSRPGKTWREPVTGMEFVWVPGGCFQMGNPASEKGRYSAEGPVHEVCVDGFWMGKYEVTNAQYRKYKSGHNSKEREGHSLNGNDQPAVYVSWKDSKAYARWLTQQGKGSSEFRLPSEAEWEYAARAGTRSARYWGDDPDEACQYANVADQTGARKWSWKGFHNCDDGYVVTAPVGRYRPNAFGLYDMLGNIWEWCADIYAEDAYSKHNRNNPIYDAGGSPRVFRGGSWGDSPRSVRCAHRFGDRPVNRDSYVGFRLLRTK